MKLGISIYCLDNAMAEGMTVYEAMDWAKAHGCEHIEFVPFHLPLVDEANKCLNTELIDSVREYAKKIDLEISTYSVNADLLKTDAEQMIDLVRESSHNYFHPDNIYGYGMPDFWQAYQIGAYKKWEISDEK